MGLARVVIIGALALCSASCASSSPGTSDSSSVDAGGAADAGRDTADAARQADSGIQPSSIIVDGTVNEAEWTGAAVATNSVASSWGEQNQLLRLRAIADGTDLYVAVEGAIEAGAGNAIVIYVDNELGGGAGVDDLYTLSDGAGVLDDALSTGITTPSEFRADFAWGTTAMELTSAGLDDRIGWRDIASNIGDFAWLDGAPSACSAGACETRISLVALGGGGQSIALFARITHGDGTQLSNQTLPEDDPDDPATVTALFEL